MLLLSESFQRGVDRFAGARDRVRGVPHQDRAAVGGAGFRLGQLRRDLLPQTAERGLHVAAELRDRVVHPGELIGLRPATLLHLVEGRRQPVVHPLRDLRPQILRELAQFAAERLGIAIHAVEPRQHGAVVGPAIAFALTVTSTQRTSPAFTSTSAMTT